MEQAEKLKRRLALVAAGAVFIRETGAQRQQLYKLIIRRRQNFGVIAPAAAGVKFRFRARVSF